MFIIDFDDTLFDTQGFKEARLKALKKLGVSTALFWTTYKKARVNSDGFFTYSDIKHAEILESLGFSKDKILFGLQKITKRIKNFIIPGVEVFLQTIEKKSKPLILLSLGDSAFQELKVNAAGFDKYFDRIFYADRTKEQVLEELFQGKNEQKVWFINDKVDETQQLLFKFKNLLPVLKVSKSIPQEEYFKSGLPYFESLMEIGDYISDK